MKIGLSAALTQGLTVHTSTFENAAADTLARVAKAAAMPIEAEWVCDRMSASGGKEAAHELVRRGVEIVVGHFSSRAAEAALPIYREREIPVILPCSSQDDLTEPHPTDDEQCLVFRLSASDTGLLRAVRRQLNSYGLKRGSLRLWSDKSAYGNNLAIVARKELAQELMDPPHLQPGAWLLLGHHSGVAQKIIQLRCDADFTPIVIVDDAIEVNLHREIPERYLANVFGIMAKLKGQNNASQEIPFYRETALAVEIASQALLSGNRGSELARFIGTSEWIGATGEAMFSANGDNQRIDYALWKFRDGAFGPSGLI